MSFALLLIPVISTITCWLLIRLSIRYFFRPRRPVHIVGMKFWGIIPRKREFFATFLSRTISNELLNSNVLKEKLAGRDTLEKAMPVIEAHIDHFLEVKIKEAIPVISMFVGERIMKQLKELFIKELEELFPSIMSQFIGTLSQNGELEKEISLKLNGIQIDTIESGFYQTFKGDLKKIELIFALIGLAAGILQLIVILVLC